MSAFAAAATSGGSRVDNGPLTQFSKSVEELEALSGDLGTARDTPDLHKQIAHLRVSLQNMIGSL